MIIVMIVNEVFVDSVRRAEINGLVAVEENREDESALLT